jgi:LmbE family N-acetylglucosaminyl deacetylase
MRCRTTLVVIVTDGTIHEKKFGIPRETRRRESWDGMNKIGAPIMFCGIPEEDLTYESCYKAMTQLPGATTPGIVFAPRIQGGSKHHDLVSTVCKQFFTSNVIYYSTYEKDNLEPHGEIAIIPTAEEIAKKNEVLDCYKSQIGINKVHFDAVRGKPEFIQFKDEKNYLFDALWKPAPLDK